MIRATRAVRRVGFLPFIYGAFGGGLSIIATGKNTGAVGLLQVAAIGSFVWLVNFAMAFYFERLPAQGGKR